MLYLECEQIPHGATPGAVRSVCVFVRVCVKDFNCLLKTRHTHTKARAKQGYLGKMGHPQGDTLLSPKDRAKHTHTHSSPATV